MPPYFHPFWWPIGDGDQSRKDWPFQMRDLLAGREKHAALRKLGYEDGRDLLNSLPPDGASTSDLAHIDTSFTRTRDVFGTVTRMPAFDHVLGPRKRVPRGYTDLEAEIMFEWDLYVEASREVVQYHKRLHDRFPAGYEDRAISTVYQKAFAPYRLLCRGGGQRPHRYTGDELRTPVFLLKIPKMQKRNAGYLGIWGLDGNTTLIWATILRFRHPELLATDHFVAAELVGGTTPDRPFDLDFAADWRIEILIDEKIRRGGKKDERASVPVPPPAPGA